MGEGKTGKRDRFGDCYTGKAGGLRSPSWGGNRRCGKRSAQKPLSAKNWVAGARNCKLPWCSVRESPGVHCTVVHTVLCGSSAMITQGWTCIDAHCLKGKGRNLAVKVSGLDGAFRSLFNLLHGCLS